MAFDPSIILGYKGVEIPNQLAQYAQMAQVENAQQQNALAQFQLGAARRAEQGQNALGQAYGAYYGGGGSMGGGAAASPAGETLANMGAGMGAARGGINYDNMRQAIVDKLRTTAPNLIPAELARINEMEQKGLLARKTQTDIDTAGLTQQKSRQELATTRTAQFRDQLSKVNSPEAAAQWTIAMYNDPHLKDTISSVPLEAALAEIPKTPEAFNVWKNQNALGMTEFIKQNKPTTFAQDTGPGGRLMSFPGLGGPATVVPGSEFTKSMTFADRNAAARLAFDQGKFAWEKANPGFELKEAEDGSIVGVNKRTLQAFPVTVGGAAPAAAPAMPGGGVPGARLPAPGAGPAAPGMAPPAAGAPGVPLMGKGTALTESQGNATAYGLRMKEANSILTPLEKAGSKNTGLVSGVVGSTLGLTPFIGEKLEGMTGSVFNALPQILGGLSPEQQKVAQARINFITAVLRKESGAAIGANEFITAEKNYFPKPGDDASVIKQKQTARDLAIKSMEIQAGPGAKNIQKFQPSGGTPGTNANDPLGLGFGG
jgi:hypothetical protein